MRLPVRIVMPCSGLTGYGGFSLGLLKHLKDSSKIAPSFGALYNTIQDSFPEEYKYLFDAIPARCRLGLVIGTPDNVLRSGTDKTILYTMYEADDIPDRWKQELRHAAEIWVPSEHSRQVFRKYHPRVKVIHIGYDDSVYKPQRGPRKNFWLDIGLPLLESAFVVGTAGVMSARKGPDLLAAAFLATFPDTNAYCVIKSRDSKIPRIEHERIIWIEADWPAAKMAKFYRALDVFVLSSRGEGLGLEPLEAAACGTPALVTRYSGPCEYIDDRDILGIDILGKEKVTGMSVNNTTWARPSVSDLTQLLRQCYDTPRRVKSKLSYWGQKAMARRFEDELLAAFRRIYE